MSFRLRVLATVGVFLLAFCGCQKGNQQASAGSPDKARATKADAKSGHSKMKSGNATKGGSKVAASHEADKTGKSKAGAKESKTKETAARPAIRKAGTLTEADNEMAYDFRQGQLITVVLDSNKASGLSWILVEPAGSVIVRDGNPVYSVKAGKNASGTETWHFRAAKPGQQTVKMEYRRKWAQSVPEKSFRFTGTVR